MRTIDADATLSFIDVGHLRNPNELCFSEMDVKNIIDKQPTISPAANWTPCSVAFPEDQSDVLIYFDRCGGEIGIGYYAERADGVKFWCAMGSMLCYNVLAWQPLPEPYRGEVSDGTAK